MKKSKNILVLFSGGIDSAYLIYQNLKQGNKVYPVYGEILNNDSKSLIEKQQVEVLYRLFRNEFTTDLLRTIEYNFKAEIRGNKHIKLTQFSVWLYTILYSNYLKEVDEVQLGYIMRDDMISWLNEITKLYNSFQPFFDFKLPKLTFPLTKLLKQEIRNKLPDNYFQETFSCENPRLLGEKGVPLNRTQFAELSPTQYVKWEDCGVCDVCEKSKHYAIFNQYERNKELEKKFYNSNLGELPLLKRKEPKQLRLSFPDLFPHDCELRKAEDKYEPTPCKDYEEIGSDERCDVAS